MDIALCVACPTRGDALHRRPPPLATMAGLLAIIVCVALAGAAYGFYPWAFSPARNWISDLGNTILNPVGAVFFRGDMLVLSPLLLAFFLGLSGWHHGQHWLPRTFLAFGQFSGVVAALALLMTGIYSENDHFSHALWATVLFVALAGATWFVGLAPLWHKRLPQRLPYLAVAACSVDLISVFARQHWLEWFAVALLLVFLGAVALGTWAMRPPAVVAGRTDS